MRLDQPWAKFCLKSYSNCHLIDFYDLNSWNLIKSSQRNQFQQLKKGWSKSSKSIDFNRKWSNLIEIQLFSTIFDKNQLFRLNNWHLDSLFWSFNQKIIEIDRNRLTIIEIWSKFDWNCDCQFELIVGFWIGPKSTIKIGQLGIRIVDDLVPDP